MVDVQGVVYMDDAKTHAYRKGEQYVKATMEYKYVRREETGAGRSVGYLVKMATMSHTSLQIDLLCLRCIHLQAYGQVQGHELD